MKLDIVDNDLTLMINKVDKKYYVETSLGEYESDLQVFENHDDLLSYLIESLKLNYP